MVSVCVFVCMCIDICFSSLSFDGLGLFIPCGFKCIGNLFRLDFLSSTTFCRAGFIDKYCLNLFYYGIP